MSFLSKLPRGALPLSRLLVRPLNTSTRVHNATVNAQALKVHGQEVGQDALAITRLVQQVREGKEPIAIPTRMAPMRTWAEERRRMGLPSETGLAELKAEVDKFEAQPVKAKKMTDSLVELHLDFISNPKLVEDYIATSGLIRLGKVFEDMDGMAAAVSYLHAMGSLPSNQDQGSPVFTVTASVDRLELARPMRPQCNYNLIGITVYVGSSSMEVLTAIEEITPDGQKEIILSGIFTMVSRNALTKKAQRVAPLLIDTPEEQELTDLGRAHKDRKMQLSKRSLERLPPTQEEARVLHEEYLRDRDSLQASMARSLAANAGGPLGPPTIAPFEGAKSGLGHAGEDVMAISTTTISSVHHIHPQSSNFHLFTFGGTLIRFAYELAWMCAAGFANNYVTFLSLDTLIFHNPVPIGSLLNLSSTITYTSQRKDEREGTTTTGQPVRAAVAVWVEIVDMVTGKRTRSNTFYFTFAIGDTKRRVAPYTYAEAIEWLEARRRIQIGDEHRAARPSLAIPVRPKA